MRKLIVFLGILALVIGTGGVTKVHAGDITIYDKAVDSAQTNTWWNRGTANNYTSEDQETEFNPVSGQGTQTGQQWDLEAFRLTGTKLSIIGGFNFPTGITNGGQYTEPLGALFLKTGGAPLFGSGNQGTTSPPNFTDTLSKWGYEYAITFAFTLDSQGKSTGGSYTIWTPKTGAEVYMNHSTDGGSVGDVSNPWSIVVADWTAGPTGTFTYTTVNSDIYGLLGGYHNIIDGIDLSFLLGPDGKFLDTWLHLTYACGNDNLMGEIPAGTVPIPPTALLLGTGLLGLMGLGWRRRKANV